MKTVKEIEVYIARLDELLKVVDDEFMIFYIMGKREAWSLILSELREDEKGFKEGLD